MGFVIGLDVIDTAGADVISAKIVGDELHVVRRAQSSAMLLCDPPRPAPDTVIKEIYEATPDRRIVLVRTVQGEHIPERTLPERFVFEGEE